MSKEFPAHCDACGQAKYLPGLCRSLEAEVERLTKGLELAAKYMIELHEKCKAPDSYMVEEIILARAPKESVLSTDSIPNHCKVD